MRPRLAAVAAVAAALAALPATANAAPVRVAHAGWTWGNPLPQGDTLDALAFEGQRGWAVGEFGTLLRTDDGGSSWQGISTGLDQDLTEVRIISRDSVVVAGGCPVRRSDDGGKTFRRLPWTASDARCTAGVASLAFPSSTTGFLLLGNGNVLRSTDSGRTWSRRTAVPGTPATSEASRIEPTDLVFTSTTTGFASTSGGNVYATVDGGSTWTSVLNLTFPVRSLWFASATVGYAAGDANVVLKTVDGGATWNEIPLPGGTPPIRSIRCVSVDVCMAVTATGDQLLRTTDGGTSWLSVSPSTAKLRAVALASTTRAVAVGEAGTTVLSDDTGRTFSPLGGDLPGKFTGLRAQTAKVAYAFGEGGALARTIDGGQTWAEIDAATSDDLRDVSYVSLRVGFALDRVGQLLRTDNAGDSWQILNTGTARAPRTVVALDTKRVLLVGPLGARRSFDGGQSFRTVQDKDVRRSPLGAADRVGDSVIAWGARRVVLSRDGGRSWRAVKRPNKGVRVRHIDLVSSKTAFLLDEDGHLYRTVDSGKSWNERPGTGTEVGYDIAFADTKNGYMAISEFGDDDQGFVMRTDDGGSTWEPQLVAQETVQDGGLAAPGKSIGFSLTNANHVLATTTGGSAGTVSSLRITTPTPHLKKAGTVRIDGRLKGARGGEPVVVSLRQSGSDRWLFETVQAASNGTFTVVARISKTTHFVAQWAGDQDRRGAGTPALRVKVGK